MGSGSQAILSVPQTSRYNPTSLNEDDVDDLVEEGQIFESPQDFKRSVMVLSLQQKFGFKCLQSSKRYYSFKCNVNNCPWKVTAGCEEGTDLVRVKRFINIHAHTAQDISQMKFNIHSKELGALVMKRVMETPSYPPREIGKDFDNRYNVKLSYMQLWRAKERAKALIDGPPEDGYKMVPYYLACIERAMPGSKLELNCDGSKFKQLFVAYECSIKGFQFCRPFLAVDACHLSGNYKGSLMSATGYDANNGLYPLAYGIVYSENDEDWTWFLNKLKEVIGDRSCTIMSDRHHSLIRSVREVFGSSSHSWCLRHLQENYMKFISEKSLKLKKVGKETAKVLLNNIAYARTEAEYEKAMRKIRKFRPVLHKWVLENGPEHWSNALFTLRRWDKYYSNQAESFNSWVRNERGLSANMFVLQHMKRLTEFLYRRQREAEKWESVVGPRIEEDIQLKLKIGSSYGCLQANEGECTVYDSKQRMYTVNIVEKHCSCLEWSMSGIPCAHACRAAEELSISVYELVEPIFHCSAQRSIFQYLMSPIATHDLPLHHEVSTGSLSNSEDEDEEDHLLAIKPPLQKRPPGRPRHKRIESQFQGKNVIHCSRCHLPGHNRRKCKNPIED